MWWCLGTSQSTTAASAFWENLGMPPFSHGLYASHQKLNWAQLPTHPGVLGVPVSRTE
jgi:hypothetical protein